MAINDWSAADLCLDSDCYSREKKAQTYAQREGSLTQWRQEAKDEIAFQLRYVLRETQAETDTDVLDLIEDYEALRKPAVYLTLHLLFNELMADQADLYASKASYYLNEYNKAFPMAVGRLNFDLDESGTITTGEQLNLSLGVKMLR